MKSNFGWFLLVEIPFFIPNRLVKFGPKHAKAAGAASQDLAGSPLRRTAVGVSKAAIGGPAPNLEDPTTAKQNSACKVVSQFISEVYRFTGCMALKQL